jgi:RimJ/RimL family protein N-acetyltransferase
MEKVFESERINYVKVSNELIDEYLKMVNDKDIQRFISTNPYTFSYEEELTWIRLKLEDNANIFSMIEKDTNKFIGNIEIMSIKDGIGELGISITKDMQDKHFGTESIKRILDYAYNELKLNGMELNVHGDNKRAIKCYENVGFVIDGEGKHKGDFHMIIRK